jgi:hypothetical protein
MASALLRGVLEGSEQLLVLFFIGRRMKPKGGYQRSVNFSQDMVRRAAMAIRENWSNAVYRLATVALRAAIRSEVDAREFLGDDPPASRPSRAVVMSAFPLDSEESAS